LEHEHAGNGQDDDRQQEGKKRGVPAAVLEESSPKPFVFAAQQAYDACQAAQAGQAEQAGNLPKFVRRPSDGSSQAGLASRAL